MDARKSAREALGHEPPGGDLYGPPKARAPIKAPEPPRVVYGLGVLVLTLGEAAAKLGLSRAELEALIDAGKIEVLPMGLTRAIPSAEVERLMRRNAPK